MIKVEFRIPGRIGGKARHRTRRSGTTLHSYTPQQTLRDEALVRSLASQAMHGHAALRGPVALSVAIYRTRPASWTKKRKAQALWITGKPDASNTLKLLEDAMNKIVWDDDAQVAQLQLIRQYKDIDEVVVSVVPLQSDGEHDA